MAVIKSVSRIIIDGRTSVDVSNKQAAAANEKSWRQVQKAVQGAQRDAAENKANQNSLDPSRLGTVSLTAARNVMASLASVDLSAMGNGVRKQIISELISASSPQEVQAILQDLVRRVNTNADGGFVLRGQVPIEINGRWQASTSWVANSFIGDAAGWVRGVVSNSLAGRSDDAAQLEVRNLLGMLQNPSSGRPLPATIQTQAIARLQELAENPKTGEPLKNG